MMRDQENEDCSLCSLFCVCLYRLNVAKRVALFFLCFSNCRSFLLVYFFLRRKKLLKNIGSTSSPRYIIKFKEVSRKSMFNLEIVN